MNADGKQRTLVIAHRGASGLAPENTLAGFRLAIAVGCDGVEMDVQLSADEQPVVIHDSRVNRTTDGVGRVAHLTRQQLQKLDAGSWFDRRLALRPRVRAMADATRACLGDGNRPFAGEPVPTLEAALSLLSRTPTAQVYIELKGAPATRLALLNKTLHLVRGFRMERSVTLLSFDHEIIKIAKGLLPAIRTAAIFSIGANRLPTLRAIKRAGQIASADEVALHYSLVSGRAVAELHTEGFKVTAWTANRKMIMRRLIGCGVDAIITNFPNRLISAIESSSARLRRAGGRY